MYIRRTLTSYLQKMFGLFPVISLTGPRQSGKTTLLKNAFPDFKYYNLERIDYREMILADPMGFLTSVGSGVIFDEVQNLPELFSYILVISDQRNMPGQYILSGSQSFMLNERISQSLAGRVHINHLLPFDTTELISLPPRNLNQIIFTGFYPRLFSQSIDATDFYPSYLQTYLERDIRSLKAVENLSAFSRFLGLCAGRIGHVLNLTSLANDAGIAVNTAKSWLSLLETSFVIYLLQPYHKNFNKRVIKAPKLYFYDTGIACSLLRITNPEMVITHYLYGALFENLIIAEIIKHQCHAGKRPSIYYWRESNGLEIDCIVEKGNNEIVAIEIKGGQTFNTDYLKNLKKLIDSDLVIHRRLIYTGSQTLNISDVQLISWTDFPSLLKEIV